MEDRKEMAGSYCGALPDDAFGNLFRRVGNELVLAQDKAPRWRRCIGYRTESGARVVGYEGFNTLQHRVGKRARLRLILANRHPASNSQMIEIGWKSKPCRFVTISIENLPDLRGRIETRAYFRAAACGASSGLDARDGCPFWRSRLLERGD